MLVVCGCALAGPRPGGACARGRAWWCQPGVVSRAARSAGAGTGAANTWSARSVLCLLLGVQDCGAGGGGGACSVVCKEVQRAMPLGVVPWLVCCPCLLCCGGGVWSCLGCMRGALEDGSPVGLGGMRLVAC
jgi:hypothetical protein